LALQTFGQAGSSVSIPIRQEDETLAVAASLHGLGKAALQRDDLDGAERYFQESLRISEKLVPNGLAVSRDLNSLGDVAQKRGIPPVAETYYQKGFAILENLDPSGADAANSLDGLARIACDLGDTAKCEGFAQQAFSIRQKLDSSGLDFARSLVTSAEIHVNHEEWDKAEESYKKALSIQEKLAPESLELAETLRNFGRFLFMRRRYDDAIANHQRALTIRERIAPDSLAVADSLRWLAQCTQGKPNEREHYLRDALTIQEKLAPGSLHVARTLAQLSVRSQGRGDLKAAEVYDRQALAIWQKLAPGCREASGIAVGLGYLLLQRGDLDQAGEVAHRALDENRKENLWGEAWLRWLLGNIAVDRGDLGAADVYYQRALEISQKINPDGTLSAVMMRALGLTAEDRGDLAKAEDYYRHALAIWEKTDPGSHTYAEGMFTVGMVVHDRGDLAQAEQYYRRALAIWEKTVPDTLYVAQALGRLGELLRERGDLAQAEEHERRAITIAEKSVPGSPDLAQLLSDLGDIFLDRGDLSEALKYHQQALVIREKVVPSTADHAASLAAVAGILRRQGQSDAAAQDYGRAIEALENQATRLGSGDELRADFRARHAGYYKDYIDLLAEQKRFDLAFQVLERLRARTLLETLTVARAEIRKGADPALLQQQHGLQQSLAAKTQRRIQLLGTKNHDAELAVLDKELGSLHSQYEEVEDRIRASSPSYAALMHPHSISAQEVQQKLLDEDTVLLEYSLGEQRSYVWVVARDSLSAHELPKRSDIEQAAREVYVHLTTRSEVRPQESPAQRQARLQSAQRAYAESAAVLSHMVLAPVARQIEGKKKLLIVSDGALQYIPFAALPIPERTRANKKETLPLLASYAVVNLPSASVLALLQDRPDERKKPTKEVAVLADPVFAKDDARVETGQSRPAAADHGGSGTSRSIAAEQLSRVLADVPSATRGEGYLRRLPFSRQEARAILALVPSGEAMEAVDFEASRATALGPELAKYRIVHFATHGLLDSGHPESSGLVFSLVNSRGEPEDGFLGLEDIYNMTLSADLVVLSACNTGLGREIQGEGLVGLTQGFMYAGAPQVVASLWSVDDAATAELMGRFYQAMEKKKLSPVAALRQAQVEILKQKRWNDPYYWAGFVIYGDQR